MSKLQYLIRVEALGVRGPGLSLAALPTPRHREGAVNAELVADVEFNAQGYHHSRRGSRRRQVLIS